MCVTFCVKVNCNIYQCMYAWIIGEKLRVTSVKINFFLTLKWHWMILRMLLNKFHKHWSGLHFTLFHFLKVIFTDENTTFSTTSIQISSYFHCWWRLDKLNNNIRCTTLLPSLFFPEIWAYIVKNWSSIDQIHELIQFFTST